MSNKPTPAEVIEKHRWAPNVAATHIARCRGCDWTKDIRNTKKTCLTLHADHVIEMLMEEVGIPGTWLKRMPNDPEDSA